MLTERLRPAQNQVMTVCHLITTGGVDKRTNLDSSEDHRPVVITRSRGTQLQYTSVKAAWAAIPSGDRRLPIRTRSGLSRSEMAVPSARNSGLERISNRRPGCELASRMMRMLSAVRHGTVDFSTTILEEVATAAILRVHSSTNLRGLKLCIPIFFLF